MTAHCDMGYGVLEAIVAGRGAPQSIRCDNGPEMTSRHMLAWCVERQIELANIEPGKPSQNGRLESSTAACGRNA